MTEDTPSYRPVSVAKEVAKLAEQHRHLSAEISNMRLNGFKSASINILHEGINRTYPDVDSKDPSGMARSVSQSKITSVHVSVSKDEALRLYDAHMETLRKRLSDIEAKIRQLGFVL